MSFLLIGPLLVPYTSYNMVYDYSSLNENLRATGNRLNIKYVQLSPMNETTST